MGRGREEATGRDGVGGVRHLFSHQLLLCDLGGQKEGVGSAYGRENPKPR